MSIEVRTDEAGTGRSPGLSLMSLPEGAETGGLMTEKADAFQVCSSGYGPDSLVFRKRL